MLGRFVLPASRLAELAASPRPGGAPGGSARSVGRRERRRRRRRVQRGARGAARSSTSVESRRRRRAKWPTALRSRPLGVDRLRRGPARRRAATAPRRGPGPHGGRAKARTGGVTAAAFPPEAVARFLDGCVRAAAVQGDGRPAPSRARRAGAHLRGGRAAGVMHGFLNLLSATALLAEGAPRASAPGDRRGGTRRVRVPDGDAWPGAVTGSTGRPCAPSSRASDPARSRSLWTTCGARAAPVEARRDASPALSRAGSSPRTRRRPTSQSRTCRSACFRARRASRPASGVAIGDADRWTCPPARTRRS